MTNPNAPFFYCPAHRIRFRTASETRILCEQGSHELGNGFPAQSWWTYCCDCATFWPARLSDGITPSKECLVCDRVIEKHFVCAACLVVSVESSAIVRRKSHFVNEKGINPSCPACKAASARVFEHNCSETGFRFLTARTTCPFCQRQIGSAASESQITITTMQCWSCGTELVAPFKFCKRCGQPQEHNSTTSAAVVTLNTTPAEQEVLELPVDNTDVDWDEEGDDNDPASDAPLEANSLDETEQPETEDALRDNTYSPQWQKPAVVQPKRRASWLLAVIAICVCAGILLPVFTLYGGRIKEPPPPPPVPTAPPGMVYIAGGEFLMGSDDGDEYERPAHKVFVASFFMDITEVTREAYQQFVNATGHRAPSQWPNNSYPPGTAKLPVTGVDWYDADAYAKWVKKRLPTEEEWEFAARSYDGRRYPWGSNWSRGAANAGDSSAQQVVSVGSFARGKTPSGLMDLAGNVWEWTSSDLVAYPNGKLSEKPSGELKIVRGGSWQEPTNQITTTYRGYLLASGAGDYSATGFRCVSEVKPDSFSKEN